MKAELTSKMFTPITVSVTIQTQAELDNLEYITCAVSRNDISTDHTLEQRDTLLSLAEIVFNATEKGVDECDITES